MLIRTNRTVFQTVFQNRGNWLLSGLNSCMYQRSPTNGPSRSGVLSWTLIQMPRKNGNRMKMREQHEVRER